MGNCKKGCALLLALGMLCALFGCSGDSGEVVSAAPAKETALPVQQLAIDPWTSAENAPTATDVAQLSEEPEAIGIPVELTPAPTDAPTPTRAPIEGDVTTRFPNYDTGTDADYSYQSDELRIAIKVVEDEDWQMVYYVADVWMRNISAFRTGFGRGKFNTGTEDAESFASREHAVFGVNGTYNKGILFHNGELVRKAPSEDNKERRGIMVLYRDGSMETCNLDAARFDLNAAIERGAVHIWQFGPVLVQNSEAVSGLKRFERHPRILVGYHEPGHYTIIAVDGRTKKSIGMTEQEEAELMLSYGCVEAMNFDGGTSAVMTFMGKIISTPSVMGTGREEGGRNLKDMLLFAEYDAAGNAPALSDVLPEKVRVNP